MENILNIIFTIIIVCWILILIQSHRMFYIFRTKYPEIARKEIPDAFKIYANPGKFIFFFRKKNITLLRNDHTIWQIRKQILLLFFLSFGGLAVIVCISIFFFF